METQEKNKYCLQKRAEEAFDQILFESSFSSVWENENLLHRILSRRSIQRKMCTLVSNELSYCRMYVFCVQPMLTEYATKAFANVRSLFSFIYLYRFVLRSSLLLTRRTTRQRKKQTKNHIFDCITRSINRGLRLSQCSSRRISRAIQSTDLAGIRTQSNIGQFIS